MTYQVTGLATKLTSISYAVFYAMSSGTISVVTLIKLRVLISKHKAQLKTGCVHRHERRPISNQRDPCEASEKGPEDGESGIRIFLVGNNNWLYDKDRAFSFWCYLGIHQQKNISATLCSIQSKVHADHSHVQCTEPNPLYCCDH